MVAYFFPSERTRRLSSSILRNFVVAAGERGALSQLNVPGVKKCWVFWWELKKQASGKRPPTLLGNGWANGKQAQACEGGGGERGIEGLDGNAPVSERDQKEEMNERKVAKENTCHRDQKMVMGKQDTIGRSVACRTSWEMRRGGANELNEAYLNE